MPTPRRQQGRHDLAKLDAALANLHASMRIEQPARPGDQGRKTARAKRSAPTAVQLSAANLHQYLAFRRHDLRQVQQSLTDLGLSSLGRSEAHIWTSVQRVREALALMLTASNRTPKPSGKALSARARQSSSTRVPATDLVTDFAIEPAQAAALLADRTDRLLGPAPATRRTRIMVTMPTEAATDLQLVRGLLDAGMDVMRINCAHDGPDAWAAMIANLRKALPRGRACPVLMDIPGPKARTDAIRAGHAVIKVTPPTDDLGRPLRPARVLLTTAERLSASIDADLAELNAQAGPNSIDAAVPITGTLLKTMRKGTRIRFTDTRGRIRTLLAVAPHPRGWLCHCTRTAYLVPGIILRAGTSRRGVVAELPAGEGVIVLRARDQLILTADQSPGSPAQADSLTGELLPARIPFTLPEVFADLKPGQRVLLDDGKIEAVIQGVNAREVTLLITSARENGCKLRAAKGVNFPDAELSLDPLTTEDLEHLHFVAKHADLVGFSFVRRAADIRSLRAHLARLKGDHVGVVLKIETAAAFQRLPELLLEALTLPSAGVMIARGDLAVEVGWERLAEVQEEILWLCEAAHVPVIWATQVLETLAKKGLPSRGEITDAAMSQRAECVMLNKGPYVTRAVRMLDNILRRMSEHQSKKRSMLRPLKVAARFTEPA